MKSMRAHSKDEGDTWREQEVAPTLNQFDTGGESQATVLISEPLLGFQPTDGKDFRCYEDQSPALKVGTGLGIQTSGPAVLFQEAEYGIAEYDEAGSMRAGRIPEHQMLLTSSTAGSPARTSAWPVGGPAFPASVARSGMNSSGLCASCGHDGSSLRMFLDSFPQESNRAPTSVSYYGGWSTSGMAWPGGFWTRGGSESPSGAVVSSLSAVLETRSVPRRYWLSARAAAGILRRAAKRGKTLPPRLMTALEGLASSCR